MTAALTVHKVQAGGYLPITDHGLVRKLPKTHVGLWCELCEWTLSVPVRTPDSTLEQLRKQHLGSAHLSMLTSGAAVINPELRRMGGWK